MYAFTIENDLEKTFILTSKTLSDVTIINPKVNKSIKAVYASKFQLDSKDKMYKYEFEAHKQRQVIITSLIKKNYQLNDLQTPAVCLEDYKGIII